MASVRSSTRWRVSLLSVALFTTALAALAVAALTASALTTSSNTLGVAKNGSGNSVASEATCTRQPRSRPLIVWSAA